MWPSHNFFSYNLDLELMTLILKFDLDMVKMYLHIKNEVYMSRCSTVIAWTDRNTDTHTDMTENITYSRVVIMHEANNQLCISTSVNSDTLWTLFWKIMNNEVLGTYRCLSVHGGGWVCLQWWPLAGMVMFRGDGHIQWYWHLVVATKTCTICKQVVRILLECFLVETCFPALDHIAMTVETEFFFT